MTFAENTVWSEFVIENFVGNEKSSDSSTYGAFLAGLNATWAFDYTFFCIDRFPINVVN